MPACIHCIKARWRRVGVDLQGDLFDFVVEYNVAGIVSPTVAHPIRGKPQLRIQGQDNLSIASNCDF